MDNFLKCDYCGKIFKGYRGQEKQKHKFCSRACNGKYQEKKNIIETINDYAILKIKDVEVLIDTEDIEKINNLKWLLCYDKTIKNYYIQAHERGNWKNRKTIKLHRFIMNCPDDMVVDHINRNTLDNRKQNLRICTNRQNAYNKGEYSNNKLKLKYIYKSNNVYVCKINVNGKNKYIKSSKNLDIVIKARDEFLKNNQRLLN